MAIFLLNSETFKRSFLDGDGKLVLSSDQDIWMSLLATGGRFLPTVARIADLNFEIKNGGDFRFGSAGGLNLKIGGKAGHQIRLIWPDEAEKVLKDPELAARMTDEDVCLKLTLSASADAAATARFPSGPISVGFGIQAGGSAGYEYCRIYNADLTAGEILTDLFSEMRLPQQAITGDAAPVAGEVLALEYGGYLKLSGTFNWGYSLTGTRSIEFNDLSADLNYALKAMAGISVGYSVAGEFRIEARQGRDDGWVRLAVRKNDRTQVGIAADFSFDLKHDLKGLPKSADEFLTRIIGSDAATFLDYFHKARKYSSLDELEKALAPAVREFTHLWAGRLLGKPLTDSTLEEFLSIARTVSEIYQDVDQGIVDLYRDYLGRIPQLRKVLDGLIALTDPMELLTREEDDDLKEKETWWELIEIVWGANIYPLLLEKDEFLRFQAYARKIRSFIDDDMTAPVRDVIASLTDFLPLEKLFEELGSIKNAGELRNLADRRLQDLAERLIGKAFEEIGNREWEKAFKSLKAGLENIEKFKENWYSKLRGAVKGNFRFALHAAWNRARRDEHLIDVELDLRTEEGRRLAELASSGDFSEALASFRKPCVRLNKGIFTQSVTTSAHFSINVMGFGYDSLRQLTQNVEETIEESEGGLLHVYASETSLKRRRESGRKFKETVETNLLLRSVGESLIDKPDQDRSWLIETMREMSIQYDFLRSDERTRPDELTRYLELAGFLGMIADRPAYVSELGRQFPDGFGNVTVKYQIRYDDAAIREIFESIDQERLRRLARLTMREVIASKYIGMKRTDWLARVGFAYLAPALHEAYDRQGAQGLDKFRVVTLPGWHTGGAPTEAPLSKTDIALLKTLCNIEKSFADRTVRLAGMVGEALTQGKPVPLSKLKEAAGKFVEMLDRLDDWRENAFFATLDKLIAELSENRAARRSMMVLEVTPPGGRKVTKVLMPQ